MYSVGLPVHTVVHVDRKEFLMAFCQDLLSSVMSVHMDGQFVVMSYCFHSKMVDVRCSKHVGIDGPEYNETLQFSDVHL